MMVAMMLPALALLLLSYRRSLRAAGNGHLWEITVLAGVGYFLIWAIFGALAYPLGVAVSAALMQWHILASWLPLAFGIVLLLAGCIQLTSWKARTLNGSLFTTMQAYSRKR